MSKVHPARNTNQRVSKPLEVGKHSPPTSKSLNQAKQDCHSQMQTSLRESGDRLRVSREAFEADESKRREGFGGIMNGLSDWVTGNDKKREAIQSSLESLEAKSLQVNTAVQHRDCVRNAYEAQGLGKTKEALNAQKDAFRQTMMGLPE